jgi:hypothetical protein
MGRESEYLGSWNKKVEELDGKYVIPPKRRHRKEGIHSTAGRAVETADINAVCGS